MNYAIKCALTQCTLVIFPMVVLQAGCASSSRTEYRSTSDTSSNRIVGEPVDAGDVRETDRTYTTDEQPARSGAQFDISLDEIRGHVRDNSAVIIDARSPEDFAKGHVRGAINVPSSRKESAFAQVKERVAPDQFIIIYCGSPQCPAGETVYEYLLSQGYSNMKVYKPGWKTLSAEKDLH